MTDLVIQKNFQAKLDKMKPEFAKLLGDQDKAQRFTRIILTEVKRNPKLLDCTEISLFSCIMETFRHDMEVGGQMAHAYLIPYGKNVTFQIGYKGWMEMARRSGQIKSLNAYPIYEAEVALEKFKMDYGKNEVHHEPILFDDAGKRVGWWAKAVLENGESVIHFMSMDDINKRKAKAMSKNIWSDWALEMEKKTVLKALCKLLPLAIKDQRLAAKDEHIIKDLAGEEFSYPEDEKEVEVDILEDGKHEQ